MSLVARPSRRFGTRSAQLFWRLPLVGRVRVPRNLAPLLLAGAVGLAAGFAAVVLTAVVDGLIIVFDELASILDGLAGGWTLMLVPAIAAIPVALIVSRISSESQGAGVPYVMVAVERAGGFVRPIIAPAKLIATGFTLGGGGAAGREGPIVLIAASLASTIGRLTRQPSDMLVLMVAAAAAGGIAATFNTPIAGTFFALEVVLRRFNVRNFTIVVVSAVVANIVAVAFYGSSAGLDLPDLEINSSWELFLHAIVGVSAAIAGILFVRTRFFTEDVFEFLGVKLVARPILGLFGVGVLALIEADILGSGLDQIRIFAEGETAVSTLAVLMVLKLGRGIIDHRIGRIRRSLRSVVVRWRDAGRTDGHRFRVGAARHRRASRDVRGGRYGSRLRRCGARADDIAIHRLRANRILADSPADDRRRISHSTGATVDQRHDLQRPPATRRARRTG